MAKLVTRYSEVVANVERFNSDLKNLKRQLAQFKHWYYIPGADLFGPSKFIGYRDVNARNYAAGANKSGIDTENVLRKWFKQLPERNKWRKELYGSLLEMLNRHGKTPNQKTAIHVSKTGR